MSKHPTTWLNVIWAFAGYPLLMWASHKPTHPAWMDAFVALTAAVIGYAAAMSWNEDIASYREGEAEKDVAIIELKKYKRLLLVMCNEQCARSSRYYNEVIRLRKALEDSINRNDLLVWLNHLLRDKAEQHERATNRVARESVQDEIILIQLVISRVEKQPYTTFEYKE
jgi:hypothetical protein